MAKNLFPISTVPVGSHVPLPGGELALLVEFIGGKARVKVLGRWEFRMLRAATFLTIAIRKEPRAGNCTAGTASKRAGRLL